MDTTNAENLYKSACYLLNIAQATFDPESFENAVKDFKAAAGLGYAEAYVMLAYCSENELGLEWDEDEILKYYKKAADLGSNNGAYNYAYKQYRNYEDDAYDYTLKAMNGDTEADAAYLLGLLYYHGIGCEQDEEKSFEAHSKSAKMGNTDAMFELYVFYSQGIGCDPNTEKAMEWNEKAARLGHYRACFNMGWYYETGKYYEQDMGKAVEYYARASNAGNGKATAYLGILTQKGLYNTDTTYTDGKLDDAKAQKVAGKYYQNALSQGFYDVQEYVEGQGLRYEA